MDVAAHRKAVEACQKEIQNLKKKLENLQLDDGETEPDILSRVAHDQGVTPAQAALKPRRVMRGHFGKVYALSWGHDSKKLCSAAQDGKLMLWNCVSGIKIYVISLRSSWVMSCSYSNNGQLIASGGLDNAISVYRLPEQVINSNSKTEIKDASDAYMQAELNAHEGYVSHCKFIDGNRILSSSGDSTCALFDIESQHASLIFKGHESDIMSFSVNKNDNNMFVSCSVDTTCKLWDIRSGSKCIKTFRGHESDVNSVDMFYNGNCFITGSDDTTCRLYDIRACKQLSVYQSSKLLCGVTSVAVSSTAKLIFAGYDLQDLWVWDTQLGIPAQVIDKAHGNRVSCVAVSPNGQGLASGSWDYLLKIWA